MNQNAEGMTSPVATPSAFDFTDRLNLMLHIPDNTFLLFPQLGLSVLFD